MKPWTKEIIISEIPFEKFTELLNYAYKLIDFHEIDTNEGSIKLGSLFLYEMKVLELSFASRDILMKR
jgi:hypothetical protein